jgi:hypothetical protein
MGEAEVEAGRAGDEAHKEKVEESVGVSPVAEGDWVSPA